MQEPSARVDSRHGQNRPRQIKRPADQHAGRRIFGQSHDCIRCAGRGPDIQTRCAGGPGHLFRVVGVFLAGDRDDLDRRGVWRKNTQELHRVAIIQHSGDHMQRTVIAAQGEICQSLRRPRFLRAAVLAIIFPVASLGFVGSPPQVRVFVLGSYPARIQP